MADETLSMTEAKKILDESASAVIRFETKLINNGEDFEEKLSKIWEDEYAVSFIKEFWSRMQNLIQNTEMNYTSYAMTIKEIAEAYAKTGGVQPLIVLETQLPKNMAAKAPTVIGKVQNHFPLSDEFGFKNIETGPNECGDLFDEALSSLINIAGEVAADLDKINAFGNQKVKSNIEGYFKSILQNTMMIYTRMKTESRNKIYAAANKYKKTGEEATSAVPTIEEVDDDFLKGKNIVNQ